MAKEQYNDQTISSLKGADRVRKRPAVIFGSEGLEGCQHSFFEILSNSIDESREGYGKEIVVTVYQDRTIEVDDHGRGVPLGYNEKEQRWNWDLIFCELYAGGKYDNNNEGGAYEYSLGLNGLGACATQYSSEFMTVESYDGVSKRTMTFKKGKPAQKKLKEEELTPKQKRTGTVIRWKPDLEVFTDINIPNEFFTETLRRQSVVNAGVKFVLISPEELKMPKYIKENVLDKLGLPYEETTSLEEAVAGAWYVVETIAEKAEEKEILRRILRDILSINIKEALAVADLVAHYVIESYVCPLFCGNAVSGKFVSENFGNGGRGSQLALVEKHTDGCHAEEFCYRVAVLARISRHYS